MDNLKDRKTAASVLRDSRKPMHQELRNDPATT
jgi:hypothetical protein